MVGLKFPWSGQEVPMVVPKFPWLSQSSHGQKLLIRPLHRSRSAIDGKILISPRLGCAVGVQKGDQIVIASLTSSNISRPLSSSTQAVLSPPPETQVAYCLLPPHELSLSSSRHLYPTRLVLPPSFPYSVHLVVVFPPRPFKSSSLCSGQFRFAL